nr:GAF domain-containing protein [Anaerolineae bacterium]
MAVHNISQERVNLPGNLSATAQAYDQALMFGHDLRRIYMLEKTKRQQVELANQVLSAIFTSIPEGLVVLDDQLNVRQTNPAFCNLVEVAETEVLGQPFEQFIRSSALTDHLRQMSADGQQGGTYEILLKEPVARSVMVDIARLNAGRVSGWVLILRDQSKRKQLDYLKTEFINIAAHELRTPLTLIIGNAALLHEDVLDDIPPLYQGSLSAIVDGGQRLAGIVEQLTEFANLVEGDSTPGISTFSIQELVADSVGQIRGRSDARQVTIQTEYPDHPVMLESNQILLRGALHQLLMNAVKFNTGNGQVLVQVYERDEALVIEVSDTGIGIPKADLPNIFDPFYQVEDHWTRRVGGLGLGLTIAQYAAQQLRGCLEVSSELGKGTTFTLQVPLRFDHNLYEIDDLREQLALSHKQSLAYAREVRTLYRELKDSFSHKLISVLRDSAAILNDMDNLETALNSLLENIQRVIPFDAASVMLVEEGLAAVVCQKNNHETTLPSTIASVIPIHTVGYLSSMASFRQPVLIADTSDAAGWNSLEGHEWVRSYLGVPICHEDRVMGFINLESMSPGSFVDHHAEWLEAFADLAAVASLRATWCGQIQTQNKLLETSNQDLDTFSQMVAHDLKTPLSVILGHADLMTVGDASSQEQTESVLIIKGQARKMATMIDELLLLARIREDERSPVSVEGGLAVEAALQRHGQKIQERGIELHADTLFPPVMAHHAWLTEIFSNLIENAVKYIGRDNPHPEISIRGYAEEEGRVVRYEVQDNGLGIEPGYLINLFEKGTRYHQSEANGTGLGLYIVKRMIDKLGGAIEVDSEAGVGTTFSFKLPSGTNRAVIREEESCRS